MIMHKESKYGIKYNVHLTMTDGDYTILKDVDEVWFPENYAVALCIIKRERCTDYYRMKNIKHICVEEKV